MGVNNGDTGQGTRELGTSEESFLSFFLCIVILNVCCDLLANIQNPQRSRLAD